MTPKSYIYLVGDFETTSYEGQDKTEVWASAIVPLYSEDVVILHSIDETFKYLVNLDKNICIYYHNLKFDGAFWLDYLLRQRKMKQAVSKGEVVSFLDDKEMPNNTFKYTISDMGQWYKILIRYHSHYIEIRDSLKLLPFSVKRIGDSFQTKHKKLTMEYTGYRYAGCTITDEEKKYIANDVLVVKEALEIMFSEGHNKLTIGACCLHEFMCTQGTEKEYNYMYPNLAEMPISPEYGLKHDGNINGKIMHTEDSTDEFPDFDAYIRKSYHGGWCYCVKGKEEKMYHNGTTADVNSLYPSMMSSESGNRYPIGKPTYWKGNYIPWQAQSPDKFYFVRFRTRFYIKDGMLPTIQIKGNPLYRSTEWLDTSDIWNNRTKQYDKYFVDLNGDVKPAIVELTMTMMDFEMMREHYHLVDFEFIDGVFFDAMTGMFDQYIDKYRKIKMESKGAKRELAKLFLNNLYGKMASSKRSDFKLASVEGETVKFTDYPADDKKPGYIAIGSAITSYARCFTITAAQANYHGINKPGFIYADTDSIHCDLPANEIVGIVADPVKFCCWKLESSWDKAIFARQKTYMEHIVAENLEPISEPYTSIKCAGLPNRCKELLLVSMGENVKGFECKTDREKEFISIKRTYADFKTGLKIPSKLLPRRIEGGIVLVDTDFEMRERR